MIAKSSKLCRAPGCEEEAQSRGLCRCCYNAARNLILAGKATWEQLEKMRLSAPRLRRMRNPLAVAFAERKGTKAVKVTK